MTGVAAWVEVARIADVLAVAMQPHAQWLSDSERARLETLRHPERHAQYLAGHWLARLVLARGHGGVPMQWRLLERKDKPPAVHGHEALRISISHAGDWVAAAVADAPIGIDLELRSRVLDAALLPLLRNADEAAGALDADAMLGRWVAKEAWIKRGAGSALPGRLEQLRLHPADNAPADVRLESHAEFHFAVAIAPEAMVRSAGGEGRMASGGFVVEDAEG
ncbi:MAG: 4'-phosphopantetheinyl transferase family protein [Arenimonas sp.]